MTADKTLFTPGPLNCAPEVHAAMQQDVGSRDATFIQTVAKLRQQLLTLGGLETSDGYTAVPMQGSGTFAIESALTTLIGPEDQLLVLENGAYGKRMLQVAERAGIACQKLSAPPTHWHDLDALDTRLREQPEISHVACVHCETTTGILNPLDSIASVVKRHGRTLIVDAMSSFGGIPIDFKKNEIDALIASANKCLESVPGFGFVLLKEALLARCEGRCPSVSLDLHAQWLGLEANGQFRFTPPTHSLLACAKALELLEAEGGIAARHKRYQARHAQLIEGMAACGIHPVVAADKQSPIITAFLLEDIGISFDTLYQHLAAKELLIYPGKLEDMDCFRIGNIGQIPREAIDRLLEEIAILVAR